MTCLNMISGSHRSGSRTQWTPFTIMLLVVCVIFLFCTNNVTAQPAQTQARILNGPLQRNAIQNITFEFSGYNPSQFFFNSTYVLVATFNVVPTGSPSSNRVHFPLISGYQFAAPVLEHIPPGIFGLADNHHTGVTDGYHYNIADNFTSCYYYDDTIGSDLYVGTISATVLTAETQFHFDFTKHPHFTSTFAASGTPSEITITCTNVVPLIEVTTHLFCDASTVRDMSVIGDSGLPIYADFQELAVETGELFTTGLDIPLQTTFRATIPNMVASTTAFSQDPITGDWLQTIELSVPTSGLYYLNLPYNVSMFDSLVYSEQAGLLPEMARQPYIYLTASSSSAATTTNSPDILGYMGGNIMLSNPGLQASDVFRFKPNTSRGRITSTWNPTFPHYLLPDDPKDFAITSYPVFIARPEVTVTFTHRSSTMPSGGIHSFSSFGTAKWSDEVMPDRIEQTFAPWVCANPGLMMAFKTHVPHSTLPPTTSTTEPQTGLPYEPFTLFGSNVTATEIRELQFSLPVLHKDINPSLLPINGDMTNPVPPVEIKGTSFPLYSFHMKRLIIQPLVDFYTNQIPVENRSSGEGTVWVEIRVEFAPLNNNNAQQQQKQNLTSHHFNLNNINQDILHLIQVNDHYIHIDQTTEYTIYRIALPNALSLWKEQHNVVLYHPVFDEPTKFFFTLQGIYFCATSNLNNNPTQQCPQIEATGEPNIIKYNGILAPTRYRYGLDESMLFQVPEMEFMNLAPVQEYLDMQRQQRIANGGILDPLNSTTTIENYNVATFFQPYQYPMEASIAHYMNTQFKLTQADWTIVSTIPIRLVDIENDMTIQHPISTEFYELSSPYSPSSPPPTEQQSFYDMIIPQQRIQFNFDVLQPFEFVLSTVQCRAQVHFRYSNLLDVDVPNQDEMMFEIDQYNRNYFTFNLTVKLDDEYKKQFKNNINNYDNHVYHHSQVNDPRQFGLFYVMMPEIKYSNLIVDGDSFFRKEFAGYAIYCNIDKPYDVITTAVDGYSGAQPSFVLSHKILHSAIYNPKLLLLSSSNINTSGLQQQPPSTSPIFQSYHKFGKIGTDVLISLAVTVVDPNSFVEDLLSNTPISLIFDNNTPLYLTSKFEIGLLNIVKQSVWETRHYQNLTLLPGDTNWILDPSNHNIPVASIPNQRTIDDYDYFNDNLQFAICHVEYELLPGVKPYYYSKQQEQYGEEQVNMNTTTTTTFLSSQTTLKKIRTRVSICARWYHSPTQQYINVNSGKSKAISLYRISPNKYADVGMKFNAPRHDILWKVLFNHLNNYIVQYRKEQYQIYLQKKSQQEEHLEYWYSLTIGFSPYTQYKSLMYRDLAQDTYAEALYPFLPDTHPPIMLFNNTVCFDYRTPGTCGASQRLNNITHYQNDNLAIAHTSCPVKCPPYIPTIIEQNQKSSSSSFKTLPIIPPIPKDLKCITSSDCTTHNLYSVLDMYVQHEDTWMVEISKESSGIDFVNGYKNTVRRQQTFCHPIRKQCEFISDIYQDMNIMMSSVPTTTPIDYGNTKTNDNDNINTVVFNTNNLPFTTYFTPDGINTNYTFNYDKQFNFEQKQLNCLVNPFVLNTNPVYYINNNNSNGGNDIIIPTPPQCPSYSIYSGPFCNISPEIKNINILNITDVYLMNQTTVDTTTNISYNTTTLVLTSNTTLELSFDFIGKDDMNTIIIINYVIYPPTISTTNNTNTTSASSSSPLWSQQLKTISNVNNDTSNIITIQLPSNIPSIFEGYNNNNGNEANNNLIFNSQIEFEIITIHPFTNEKEIIKNDLSLFESILELPQFANLTIPSSSGSGSGSGGNTGQHQQPPSTLTLAGCETIVQNNNNFEIVDICIHNKQQPHGQCNKLTGKCECLNDYDELNNCLTSYCNTVLQCSTQGTTSCSLTQNKCTCKPGYTGAHCQTLKQTNNDDDDTQPTCPISDLLKCRNGGFITDCQNDTKCTCLNQWQGTSCTTCHIQCSGGSNGKPNQNCNGCLCPSPYSGLGCNCHTYHGSVVLDHHNNILPQWYTFMVENFVSNNNNSIIQTDNISIQSWLYYEPKYLYTMLVEKQQQNPVSLLQVTPQPQDNNDIVLKQMINDAKEFVSMLKNAFVIDLRLNPDNLIINNITSYRVPPQPSSSPSEEEQEEKIKMKVDYVVKTNCGNGNTDIESQQFLSLYDSWFHMLTNDKNTLLYFSHVKDVLNNNNFNLTSIDQINDYQCLFVDDETGLCIGQSSNLDEDIDDDQNNNAYNNNNYMNKNFIIASVLLSLSVFIIGL